jgi:low temperature requirement protein LtrA
MLGETVLTTGTAFTDEPFTLERLLALAVSFTGTVALWWCYFERVEPLGVEAVERAEDAGSVGLLGNGTLTLIVLALIAIAVGDEMTIAHPSDDATLAATLLIFGGPALFLVAQLAFLSLTFGSVPPSRLVALFALVLFAIAAASLELIAGLVAATAVLVVVAAADTLRHERELADPAGIEPIDP